MAGQRIFRLAIRLAASPQECRRMRLHAAKPAILHCYWRKRIPRLQLICFCLELHISRGLRLISMHHLSFSTDKGCRIRKPTTRGCFRITRCSCEPCCVRICKGLGWFGCISLIEAFLLLVRHPIYFETRHFANFLGLCFNSNVPFLFVWLCSSAATRPDQLLGKAMKSLDSGTGEMSDIDTTCHRSGFNETVAVCWGQWEYVWTTPFWRITAYPWV